jgi:hypothetical protein
MATRIYAKASDVDRGARRVIKWLVVLAVVELIPWAFIVWLLMSLWPSPPTQVSELTFTEQMYYAFGWSKSGE